MTIGHNTKPTGDFTRVIVGEEFAAFDSLPKAIRDFLNGADLMTGADANYNAIQVKQMAYDCLMQGIPIEKILAYMQGVARKAKADATAQLYGTVDPERLAAFRRALQIAANKR